MIQIKRIYDEPSKEDGYRVLVDRLWPRGISKEKAQLDEWHKEIAPSSELRKWFNHEPDKEAKFIEDYKLELKNNPEVQQLQDILKKYQTVTLVYAAKDSTANNATVLRDFLKG